MAEVEHIGPVQGFVSQEATIAPKQGIYETRDKAVCRLGTRIRVGPRVFYYAKYVADTAAGYLVGQDESAGSIVDTDNVIVCDGNYAAAAGATKVEILLAAQTKDNWVDGFFHITDGAGIGYCYGIKRNSKTGEKLYPTDPALNATTSFMLELYDPIVVALGNDATDFAITGCLYDNLRQAVSGAADDDCAMGVAPTAIDVSEAPYGWLQTWGPCTALADTSAVGAKGSVACVSDGTEGAVQVSDVFTEHFVGYILEVGDAAGCMALYLMIQP